MAPFSLSPLLCQRRSLLPPPHASSQQQPQPQPQQLLASFLAGCFLTATLLTLPLPLPPLTANANASVRLTSEEQATIKLFQRSTPSVVYITNLAQRRDAFTLNTMEIPQGAGSGFVWDDDGHIITNFHVIRGASDVRVTLAGGTDFPASVVGVDEDKDVAVLSINTKGKEVLKPIAIGTSSDLLVGQKVVAIGNPFGLDHTLTTGVISGIGREISSGNTGRPIQDVIQTDAAINPGNSGGPLLDSSGSLIGMNTAIFSPSGASSGVGFAIPVDLIKSSVDQIIQFGRVVRPIMGISFAPDAAVEQLGVTGVLVLEAREGGPAAKAGILGTTRDEYGRLLLGDIIMSAQGKKVKNASDLYRVLDKAGVGDALDVEVLRGNAVVHITIILEPSTNLGTFTPSPASILRGGGDRDRDNGDGDGDGDE